jgi:glycosyltransferase involved in cell wall biosynthesis
MMRILVITTEPVPLPGCMSTGAGIRAWGLVQGLRSCGFDAEIAMAADGVSQWSPEKRSGTKDWIFERERLDEHVRARKADLLVMQHWGLMDRLGDHDIPLAIDLAGPHLLERRFWASPNPLRDMDQKLKALSRADFLTCSGRNQRHYFLAYALMAGFDATAPDLLPVIPFSVSPELPEETEHDPETWVYAGMLLPWQNPKAGIEAALEVFQARGRGELHFIGAQHPAGDVSRGRFDKILERLNTSRQAMVLKPRPYDDLCDYLRRRGAALDLMEWNNERELAFPSRSVVYLACGLPVLHGRQSEMGELILRYDAGWLMNPHDPEGLRALFESLLDRPEELERRRENARRLVRENLTWDRTIEPLARWCANPQRRNKGGKEDSWVDRVNYLETESETVCGALNELKGRRLVKISDYIRKIRRRTL